MSIILTVDQRERAVFAELEQQSMMETVFKPRIPIVMRYSTIPVGDYTISFASINQEDVEITEPAEEMILAVIERKTLADYSASMSDGRSENIGKLLALRELVQCKIYYLIEGPANPSMTKQCARKDYKNILASIRHLQIKHDIAIINTKSKQTTASELFFLCEVYAGLLLDGSIQVTLADYGEVMEASKPSVEEVLQRKIIGSWCSLPGVATKTATLLAAKYPLHILLGDTEIPELKAGVRAKLVHPWPKQLQVAFIASIPGISKAAAINIINEVTVYEFMNCLGDLKSKRFGKKGIANINHHMQWVPPTL
jgi:ERCC4-type nuclease